MQQWKKRGTYHSVLEAIQEMSGLTEEELLSPSHIEPNRILRTSQRQQNVSGPVR